METINLSFPDEETRRKHVENQKKCLKMKLEEKVEKFLWTEFDRACVDTTQVGIIETTLELGFNDVAEEMLERVKAGKGEVAA